jgi:hypothetical protein
MEFRPIVKNSPGQQAIAARPLDHPHPPQEADSMSDTSKGDVTTVKQGSR